MNNKTFLLICVAIGVASCGITRYYFPKVQIKEVEVTKEVVRTDVQTVIHTVTTPGGGTDTTTTIIDHTTKTETASKSLLKNITKDWLLSVAASTSFKDLNPVYTLHVQRRVLGPFYLGALLTTEKQVGLSVGMEF